MLLTIPSELRLHILSSISRRDLMSIVRTCQLLHAVGVRILYEHVHFKSFDQVEAFCQFSFKLRPGSAFALRQTPSKRTQWQWIRTLELIMPYESRTEPLVTLPRSLRGRGVEPLTIDRLRMSYCKDGAAVLLVLLQCFDPREVGLSRTDCSRNETFDAWTTATGWRNVTHLTLVRHLYSSLPPIVPSFFGRKPCAPFRQAKTARLLCYASPFDDATDAHLQDEVARLLRVCPKLDRIQIYIGRPDSILQYEKMAQRGLAGKPASFFEVQAWPDGSSMWGDVHETREGGEEVS